MAVFTSDLGLHMALSLMVEIVKNTIVLHFFGPNLTILRISPFEMNFTKQNVIGLWHNKQMTLTWVWPWCLNLSNTFQTITAYVYFLCSDLIIPTNDIPWEKVFTIQCLLLTLTLIWHWPWWLKSLKHNRLPFIFITHKKLISPWNRNFTLQNVLFYLALTF